MSEDNRLGWDTSDPINVVLLGAGGNGSEFFDGLVKIHHALHALGAGGMNVCVLDDDMVQPHNCVRQRYWQHECGLMKSLALVNRANLMTGLDWQALPRRFTSEDWKLLNWCDLVVTAVDSLSGRRAVYEAAQSLQKRPIWESANRKPRYWLDLGVEVEAGQIIWGGLHHNSMSDPLPNLIANYPEVLTMAETHQRPSCSAAESLARQGLFVNNQCALAGLQMLWSALRSGKLDNSTVYFDRISQTPVRAI